MLGKGFQGTRQHCSADLSLQPILGCVQHTNSVLGYNFSLLVCWALHAYHATVSAAAFRICFARIIFLRPVA